MAVPARRDPAAARLERLAAECDQLRAENRTLERLNRLQGRFVAMASHEFKTPLTSITAYTDALLTQVDNPDFDRSAEFLGVIRDESARLLRMINRILDFSRLEYGSQLLQRGAVDLADLARDVLRGCGALLDERGQSGGLVGAADAPPVCADADLVRQALVNLVGNAIKFAPRGGHVRLKLVEEAATVALEVADDGPGIAVDDLQRVFAEFYRAAGTAGRTEGTGLGLSIVRHIVHLHGGHVTVRRRRRAGTAFAVHFPKQVTTADGRDTTELAVLRNAVRLQADFTGSRTALLLLRREDGRADPAAHMGLPPGVSLPSRVELPVAADDPDAWCAALGLRGDDVAGGCLVVPLADVGGPRGWTLLGRRTGDRAYGPRDHHVVPVLGRLAARALAAAAREPARTLEALRVLLRIRWRGVPTATAEAMDLASSLGRTTGLDAAAVARLEDAVALHDAGMDRIDDDVLLVTGRLTPEDRDEIDRHVALGLDLLAPLLTDEDLVHVIRHHHERWDGSGHPDGLCGAEIPAEARILAVVDAWFSLIRGRPGRDGSPPAEALAEIRRGAGTQFDPDVVAVLARLEDIAATDEDPATAAHSGPAVAGGK